MFNLKTGALLSRIPLDKAQDIIIHNHVKKIIRKPEFKSPGFIPHLYDSVRYEEAFAEKYGFAFDGWNQNNQYKYYKLYLKCLIDTLGICHEVQAEFEDSTLNEAIKNYFLNVKFLPNAVPSIVEKWYFEDLSSYRKIDVDIARQEGLAESKRAHLKWLWRLEQDSLNGIYIPKDIEDCLHELSGIFSEKAKENFLERGPIHYHMSTGLYMRNNWGLWGGSRLQKYFLDLGIMHPDAMSGIILESFYRRLLGKDINLDEQIKDAQEYWLVNMPPDTSKYPNEEKDLEFDTKLSYKYKDDRDGCIHVQTNSTSELIWIYDYHFGWAKIDSVILKYLEENQETRETILNKIFSKRK